MVVNEKVNVLAGFGLTPLALATAPIATQSKTPMVVMAAATSSITQASPFIVRTSFTLPQAAVAIADWAPNNGIKKVVTLVSDYGPGIDAEKFSKTVCCSTVARCWTPACAHAQPRLRAFLAKSA
jgi:branched-chain amino acid transport system substrate-binding protein